MKKLITMFCMAMCLFATSALAQEVRGVETRRAVYEGDSYEIDYYSGDNYKTLGTKNEYLGFEFTNKNSISVSVTIEVYQKIHKDRPKDDILIETKDIVLKSGESYIHKKPKLQRYSSMGRFSRIYKGSISEMWKEAAENGNYWADEYYVKYKAYKLQ